MEKGNNNSGCSQSHSLAKFLRVCSYLIKTETYAQSDNVHIWTSEVPNEIDYNI